MDGHADRITSGERNVLDINRLTKRAALAGALVMALGAAPASAAECAPEPTNQPFTHLGDYNAYFLAEGGDFEGTPRWTTSGPAWVEDGVNPADPDGSRTARLNSDGSVTSPPICVDAGRPHLRFGALARSGTGTLKVDAFYESGGKVALGKLTPEGFGRWATTPMIRFDGVAIPEGGSRQIRLRIAAAGGDWLVDGVYIDPYLRG